MRDLKENTSDSLHLTNPIPLTCHPAAVYLSGLEDNSHRTMKYSLDKMALLLSNGQCDCMTLDWSKLRYHHTAALRSALIKEYSPMTVNLMLSALRRVLLEAYKLDLIELDVYNKVTALPNVSGKSEPQGRALSREEIQAIIATCSGDDPRNVRDKAIIGVLRGGGLRRNELVNLELRDFNLKESELFVRQAKGKKSRKVYLPDEALSFIEQWLELRGYSEGALFCRVRRGGHIKIGTMHSDAIWRMLQKRAKLANIESCSPHDLRRTFCGDLLSAGVDIVTVQKLAGHASPVTTSQYDRRGDDIKRKAVKNLGF
ncbi:site-specific integrase [Geminocystis sp. GBBB08]|uniref:tyrosine-type recombinase/integrase n=1 Tax=Geminocystis sp. GBBB08 TaxID=2604140 RepID=UPI0027E39FA5|nr:site-specific integrase [Geminocystis sp. GBBB08]MBL1208287.1 site-specific integrase [Geminocystis sp. GBBB08]